jgi:hypothetical protein
MKKKNQSHESLNGNDGDYHKNPRNYRGVQDPETYFLPRGEHMVRENRHEKFQFGHNPVKMSKFEEDEVRLEKHIRIQNHRNYMMGVLKDSGEGLNETVI